MVGHPGTTVEVLAVRSFGEGTAEADAHIIARFRPQAVKHWTVEELREQAEAFLEWRSGEHPKGTTSPDRRKIKLFLDWLKSR